VIEDDIVSALTRTFGNHDGPWQMYSVRDNYVLTTTKRLAKVAYKPGGNERLASGVKISAALSNLGLPAVAPLLPYPVREAFGLVTLWPLLENEPVESYELSGHQAVALGSALADLSTAQVTAPIWDPFARVNPRLGVSSFPRETIGRTRGIVGRMQSAVSVLSEPSVFSHGDAHAANVLFFADGTLALIDFDYATLTPPGWDIACLWVSLVFENDNQEGFDVVQKAYDDAGGVPYKDQELLQVLRVLLGTTFLMTLPPTSENLDEVDYRLGVVYDCLAKSK
jgi:hypothetical protein